MQNGVYSRKKRGVANGGFVKKTYKIADLVDSTFNFQETRIILSNSSGDSTQK